MEIDVWTDGSPKTVNISKEELLRKYEYICESSECGALAFNDSDCCPACHNRDSIVTVEDYLADYD